MIHTLDYSEFEEFKLTCLSEENVVSKFIKHKLLKLNEGDVVYFGTENYLFQNGELISFERLNLSHFLGNTELVKNLNNSTTLDLKVKLDKELTISLLMSKYKINSKLGVRCIFSVYQFNFYETMVYVVFFNHDKNLDINDKRDVDRLVDKFQDSINEGQEGFYVTFNCDYFPDIGDDIVLFVNLDEYIMKNKTTKKKKISVFVQDEIEVDEEWSIYKVSQEDPPVEWRKFFIGHKEVLLDISKCIKRIEKERGKSLPLRRDLFNCFKFTGPKECKVVIFGQDPYTTMKKGEPIATGLAFSVKRDAIIPPSLRNIYIELKNDIEGFEIPNHGDLTRWATEEGIMLLNTSLTVSPKKGYDKEEEKDICGKGTHKNLWTSFIKKCIEKIYSSNKKVIFILWGREAISLKKFIPPKACILEGVHPSPLSAKRGFFGCKHFSKCNELLIGMGVSPIDWRVD